MGKIIEADCGNAALVEAVEAFRSAGKPIALTGAGISVESGIPDFRSPGGLWTVFSPEEYATIDVFVTNPEKAWRLFRAINKTLKGARPNPAHGALARLEDAGRLFAVVTQNIDSLHQEAGSKNVLEIHGSHKKLQCLRCDSTAPAGGHVAAENAVPKCGKCGYPLKPDVVLFGEAVRSMDEIMNALDGCDALLVVGTSATVAPANLLPSFVKRSGGAIFEFNIEETALTRGAGTGYFVSQPVQSDWLVKGPASRTVTRFAEMALEKK
jgi:NAD-dependent deacetylase